MVMIVGNDTTQEDQQLTKIEQLNQPKKEKNKLEKLLHRADTWKGRILNFGKGDVAPEDYDLDKDAQVAHANIAIVSSGVMGKGPGQSTRSVWRRLRGLPLYRPALPLCTHCQPL